MPMLRKVSMDQCSINGLGRLDEEFPDNLSLSDLCDCGRHKSQHTHQLIQSQNWGPFPKSDYQSTFIAVQNPRPRSSKRPPMTARDPRPVPMCFSTNQRDAFKLLELVEKVKPIIHADQYEPSAEPLDARTYYAQEFTPKQVKPEPIHRQKSRQELLRQEPAAFDGTTTNKQHFKRWVPQPNLAFGELPSFTGSILFPEKENLPLSTMRQSYMGSYAPSPPLIKAATETIRLEGEHEFDTTHNLTYRKIEGDHRAQQVIHADTTPLKRKGKLMGITQTKQDFPGYKGNQPRPPEAVEPPQPMIDLKFDNKRSFLTENRATYRGHDVTEHPAPVSCKKAEEEYKLPSIQLETETSQQRDYRPIDLKMAQSMRVKVPLSTMRIALDAPFVCKTMNSEFFQNWGVQPRHRYGDFHENRQYLAPKDPFNAQSVTQTSYIHQPAEPVRSYRPEQHPVSKDGEMNFQTVYQEEFQKKQVRMCRAQVYLIQQELKRRKNQQQQRQQQQQETNNTRVVVSQQL